MSTALTIPAAGERLTLRDVSRSWWPLGASWLLMGLELPLFAAAVARLPEAEIHLAAYGGVVFPIALIVEAPIMMLLAASTALARDEASFRLVRRFMRGFGLALTLLHAVIAFTPLFDVVALRLLGAPAETLEPARIGLRVMLPWTWSIAYRRLHQGVLIRFRTTRPVAAGTVVRLAANVLVLGIGVLHGGLSGIVVGTAGVAAGVLAEAAFIGLATRPIVHGPLREASAAVPALDAAVFLQFYVPLALTQVLSLGAPPLAAAAIARMPEALLSLAAWPAALGVSFLLRAPSFALNEVVVALLDRPGAADALRRFTRRLAVASTAIVLLLGATPLGEVWFAMVSGLAPEVAHLARIATLANVLLPALTAYEHWHQGRLVHAHRTRAVTVGMAIYLSTLAAGLGVGLVAGVTSGIVAAMLATTLAAAAKVAWLAAQAREAEERIVPG